MSTLHDLRLWGNKIDLPQPLLYEDVSKIAAYLKASEKERFVMYTQMRYFAPGKEHIKSHMRAKHG